MNIHQKNDHISYVEQYLEPLKQYLTDDCTCEIVINPDGSIFAETADANSMEQLHMTLAPQSIKRLGAQMAGETNNQLGALHPMVSGHVVVWGKHLRVQVIISPAVEKGVSLSIRKYVVDTVSSSTFKFLTGSQVNVDKERKEKHKHVAQMAEKGDLPKLFKFIIENRYNILVAGGTSSGKTTLARALLSLTDPAERIITIEDAQELFPSNKNQVALISDRRNNSERAPSKLITSALRMRPDRIILGELRGVEAYDFLEAINTGHPGAVTTIHADSPSLAFERLALMVLKSGVQMSYQDIINYARKTIDLIIQVGRRNGKRGVLEVYLPTQE